MKRKDAGPVGLLIARIREAGVMATFRAVIRRALRKSLVWLELKDYGFSLTASPTDQEASFVKAAHDARARGDLHAATVFWQRELGRPAMPFIGLSEVAEAEGDIARAEAILQDALKKFDNAYVLLEAQCLLAINTRRYSETITRLKRLEESEYAIDPKLYTEICCFLLTIGDDEAADKLLEQPRQFIPGHEALMRAEALLAEARLNWDLAARIWEARSQCTEGTARAYSEAQRIRALIRAGALEDAEAATDLAIQNFPRTASFLKLSAEIAIYFDAWAVALDRWHKYEKRAPLEAGMMPSEWIYRIGVDEARRRTESIRIGHLRATGMLALAATIQSVDEVEALLIARRARRFYPENVRAMVARMLSVNIRHSASIWWSRKLLESAAEPREYYPLLVEALLASSRLEDCEAVLETYTDQYERDNLWLRAMVEIHYRRGDFAAMRDMMQIAVTQKLPVTFKSLRVTRWVYNLIRLHPAPQSFLPEEIHDLLLRIATLYDGKFLSDSIGMLLNPTQGDAAVETYAAGIAETAAQGIEMDPVQQEEMLQFFMRRRDWGRVEALLALPLPSELTATNVKKVWNIVRNKLDIQLGRGDVAAAEETACAYLDRLKQNELDGFAMSLTTGLLFRLPLSEGVASRLRVCAERLGFTQMAERIGNWQRRYVGLDAGTTLNLAGRKRCFIVGNAPSIADLPLGALAGEDIFCVNRGMRALDVGLPQPKYLVVADPLVYKNHAEEIDADGTSVEKFFVASNCLWRKPPTVSAIPLGSSGLKLSLAPFRHAPLHFHRGETVVVLAAQLAHLMGYKEIYIIGVDLDYSGAVTHFYGGGRKETERLANFRPGGSGAEMVNLAFANLQKVVEPDGCRLYNAALGGKLDSLERVNFYDVLGVPRPEDAESNNDIELRAAQ